jgi:hypothetical protein
MAFEVRGIINSTDKYEYHFGYIVNYGGSSNKTALVKDFLFPIVPLNRSIGYQHRLY